jgi:hypothetical protein
VLVSAFFARSVQDVCTANPTSEAPQRGWHAQVRQVISVLLKSTPLKQSEYDVPTDISLSRSSVCLIIAMVWSSSSSEAAEVSLCNAFLASWYRLLRTSHQGESGAKEIPMTRGTGHIHCRAYGMR